MQLTLSVYLVAFAGAMLIYGPPSDRFAGRSVGRVEPLCGGEWLAFSRAPSKSW